MCESPLDAQRCVDLGFVDKVLGGPEMGVQLSDMAREALRESVKESGRQGMELKEQFKKETGREHQGGLPDDWEEVRAQRGGEEKGGEGWTR